MREGQNTKRPISSQLIVRKHSLLVALTLEKEAKEDSFYPPGNSDDCIVCSVDSCKTVARQKFCKLDRQTYKFPFLLKS